MTFIETVVRGYVQSQWTNFRRALNEPQAREELLGGALLFAYKAGTTEPMTTFRDGALSTANPNPLMFNAAGMLPAPIVRTGYCDIVLKKLPAYEIVAARMNTPPSEPLDAA